MTEAAVGIAGLILTVPGTIDLCVKYGQFLEQKMESYHHMQEITRLHRFIAELIQGELHSLLCFFHSFHGAQPLEDQTRTLFEQLRYLLENVISQVSSLDFGVRAKLGFSFRRRKSLENACKELEEWHTRFLRRAIVFLLFGGPSTTGSISTNHSQVLRRVQRIRKAILDPIPESKTTKLLLDAFDTSVQLRRLDSSNVYASDVGSELVEYRTYDASTAAEEIKATQSLIRDLAAGLHESDPSFMGLLHCNGFSAEPAYNRFALRFQYPVGKTKPQTLDCLLRSQKVRHSLSDRLVLARKLASAVLYLHSCGFVHKNLRPENVLVFDTIAVQGAEKKSFPDVIGEPFLVGFDGVRKSAAASNMIRVEEWEKNIYLHPDRHRMSQGDEFTMRHDIYSLGVVLLEIALWDTFTNAEKGAGRYLWEKRDGSQVLRTPQGLKARYLEIARSHAHRVFGDKYRDVVISCLEGLEDEEKGGILDDQDGIVVGSAYMSQIMTKLEGISL
jgi:hypothetical protein